MSEDRVDKEKKKENLWILKETIISWQENSQVANTLEERKIFSTFRVEKCGKLCQTVKINREKPRKRWEKVWRGWGIEMFCILTIEDRRKIVQNCVNKPIEEKRFIKKMNRKTLDIFNSSSIKFTDKKAVKRSGKALRIISWLN